MTRKYHNHKGFSLIELCVAMAISGIVMAAIYSAYRTQLGSYVTQQTIVDMQQNARAAMYLMEREIRLAGYDPTRDAGASIVTANPNSITFTMDLNDDGDIADSGEQMQYAMSGDTLVREDVIAAPGVEQTAALNIDALDFAYLDEDGDTTADTALIRSVQITLVARAGDSVPVLGPDHTDNNTYRSQQGVIILNAQNDGFRRFLLTSDVKCRNLSLE